MRSLVWADDALRDFDDAVAYIARESPAGASGIIYRVNDAALALAELSIGHPGRVPGTYEKLVRNTPYILAYAVTDDSIVILRVVHVRRNWPEGEWPK